MANPMLDPIALAKHAGLISDLLTRFEGQDGARQKTLVTQVLRNELEGFKDPFLRFKNHHFRLLYGTETLTIPSTGGRRTFDDRHRDLVYYETSFKKLNIASLSSTPSPRGETEVSVLENYKDGACSAALASLASPADLALTQDQVLAFCEDYPSRFLVQDDSWTYFILGGSSGSFFLISMRRIHRSDKPYYRIDANIPCAINSQWGSQHSGCFVGRNKHRLVVPTAAILGT